MTDKVKMLTCQEIEKKAIEISPVITKENFTEISEMICEKVYFPDEPLPDEFYLDVTLPEEIEYRNAESFVSENVWLWMVVFTVACYQRNYAIHSWLKSHCRAHFADDIDTPSLGFL